MSGGSTLPRRALGRRLRDLRLKAGKSLLAAALTIEVSKQTIGRMEEGEVVRIFTAQFRDLLEFYEVDDEAKAEVLGLIEEVKASKGDPSVGWWRAYADVVNPHFDHFMELEQACSRLTTFQLTMLPGLLHTNAYRRWIMKATDPDISADEEMRHLELIERRQRKLAEGEGFSLEALFSESALRHQFGGREVMAEELRHLTSVGELSNVSIRVIPFDAGPHLGLVAQSFTLFEFPSIHAGRTPERPVVFVEGFTGSLFLEDGQVIERHRSAVEDLRRVALSENDTRRLVQEIAEEYGA